MLATAALTPSEILPTTSFGTPAGTASALDAWQAASFKSQAWEVDAQGKAVRRDEPVSVAGKEERLPLAGGRVTVKVGARSFRVLSLP